MTKSDFSIVAGKEKTVITFKGAVRIEIENRNHTNEIENMIKRVQTANRIIDDVIKGQSEYLVAQALIYAIESIN